MARFAGERGARPNAPAKGEMDGLRPVSHSGGVGRVRDLGGARYVVPMGRDVVACLAGEEEATDGRPVAYESLDLRAPAPRTDPPRFLTSGDTVAVEIERLGTSMTRIGW